MKKIILFSLFISSIMAGVWLLQDDKQDPLLCAENPKHDFPDKYFFPIELMEGRSGIPYLEASIDGIAFLASLDLGFCGVLSLPKEVLNCLADKSKGKPGVICGIRGKQYRVESYKVPPLHFGGITVGDFEAEETNLDFERDVVIENNSKLEERPSFARIGWKAFPKVNLLLELEHPKMACCDGLDTLKEEGYKVDGAVFTDLLIDRNMIEFYVDTSAGPLRCVLDTGSSLNVRHKASDPFVEEPIFFHIDRKKEQPPMDVSIQGHVVGPIYFYEAELPCGIEAIVGMDFLNEHCIFLDFVNEKIYFLPPQPSVAEPLEDDSIASVQER